MELSMYWKITWAVHIILHILYYKVVIGQLISIVPDTPAKFLRSEIISKQSINSCVNEEIVNLGGLGLREIPTEFIKSKTLRSISIEHNELRIIPFNTFHETPNLECLNLARNKIPLHLLRLRHDNLKSLIIDYQNPFELETLDDMCDVLKETHIILPALQNLSSKGFPCDCSMFVEMFPSLRNLDCSGSGIEKFELNTSNFRSHLSNIHLERNNIEELILPGHQEIEGLYLDGNILKTSSFNMYSNVKLLSLSNCSLTELINFRIPTLEKLDLSYNEFTNISIEWFQGIPNLVCLDLSGNGLREIPNLNYLSQLKMLALDNNMIQYISSPILSASLTVLSLRGNRIFLVHSMAFTYLSSLEKLDLSHNELQSLPNEWDKYIENLHYLNLESNKFSDIKNMSITHLLKLTDLYIKGNYIKIIDMPTVKLLPKLCTLHVM